MDAGNQNLSYPLHIYNLSAQQPPRNSLQAEQEIHTTAAAADGIQTVAVAMAVNEAAAGGAAAAEEGEQNIRSLTQAAQFHNHTQNRPFLHHDQNAIDSRNVHGGGGVSNNVKKVVRYRECRKNQAAAIGGYAIDGCGEFMPSAHQEFQCAACHCHRNFHRRDVDGEKSSSDCQHARR